MYVLMLVGSWSISHGEAILAELITGNMYIHHLYGVCVHLLLSRPTYSSTELPFHSHNPLIHPSTPHPLHTSDSLLSESLNTEARSVGMYSKARTMPAL